MAVFQPPPTWAEVIVTDERTGKGTFNPVWLKWFVDLVQVIDDSGGGSGTIQHNDTGGLQGGTANQFYHLTNSQLSQVIALGTIASQNANNVAITGGTINGTSVGATTRADVLANNLGTAGYFRPADPTGAVQTGTSIYAGSGAPNNANGNDGDYYFRTDGGAVTHLYFKTGGAWAGLV